MMLLRPEGREHLRVLGRVGGIGVELVVFTMVGWFGGRWLDGQLDSAPWMQWIGLFLGLAAGVKSLYVLARRESRRTTNDERRT
jgi:ATP synthase protein I